MSETHDWRVATIFRTSLPGLSYNWWGFKARDTLQDSTDNSSFDKVETASEWQVYFSQFKDTTDALPCYLHLPVCLWIMDPHSRAPKKNTVHGNEMLPHDTTHFIQRPCYQRGSPCQDPAGNRTTGRPPDRCKETQTAVVWTCLPFIRSGQNHLARHSERGKKTKQTGEEVGRQHQGMDRPGVCEVPEGRKNRGKWRKLVVKSSVVPQLPLRLRDRWWWWSRRWIIVCFQPSCNPLWLTGLKASSN